MACDNCWATPQSKKHSYLVQMSNEAGELFVCVVQTECTHDLQEWVDANADQFPIKNPRVISVDPKAASHIPLVDPVT